jgi:hypothetical protein
VAYPSSKSRYCGCAHYWRGGDEAAYRDLRDRYRSMAESLAFEGHIAWAKALV